MNSLKRGEIGTYTTVIATLLQNAITCNTIQRVQIEIIKVSLLSIIESWMPELNEYRTLFVFKIYL